MVILQLIRAYLRLDEFGVKLIEGVGGGYGKFGLVIR